MFLGHVCVMCLGGKNQSITDGLFVCAAVFGTCFIGSDLEDIAEAYKNLSHCAQAPQKRTYTKPSK